MLRINEENITNGSILLRLEGKLIDQWVGLFRIMCEQILNKKGKLSLDLTEVTYADNEGLRLLQHLNERELALITCSPFLNEQLNQFQADSREDYLMPITDQAGN